MIVLFNDDLYYILSYCSDEEFKTLNWFKRISYKWCMRKVLKQLKYDKIAKLICDKESIKLCIKLSKYMRHPTVIDMDGIEYMSNSEYWEKDHGLSSE